MKKNRQVAFTFSDITEEVRGRTPQDRTTEIDVIMLGEWISPWYGKVEVTMQTLQEIVANFKANTRGIEIAVDYSHYNEGEAAWWVKDLYIVGDRIKALIEWTVEWYQSIRDGEFRYFSPEVVLEEGEVDPSTWNIVRNILVGGGITNRPFFKGLQALKASEMADNNGKNGYSLLFNSANMKKFSEIKEGLSSLTKISAEQFAEARLAFSELPQEEQDTAKADLDTLETKTENEVGPNETPNPETPKKDETPNEDPKPEEKKDPETPAPETPTGDQEGKQFSEASVTKIFSEFGVKSADELSKKFAELRDYKESTTRKEEVARYVFSESNKGGVFLSKVQDSLEDLHKKIGSFAFSEVMKVMKTENLAPSSMIFSEIGKGSQENPGSSEDPIVSIARKAFSEAPEGTSPIANAHFAVAKAFAEKSGKDFTAHTQEAYKLVEGLNLDA